MSENSKLKIYQIEVKENVKAHLFPTLSTLTHGGWGKEDPKYYLLKVAVYDIVQAHRNQGLMVLLVKIMYMLNIRGYDYLMITK